MRFSVNKLLFNKYIYSSFTISKRFAGHSKWANIKHTKQAKDHERMMLFHHLKQQMRVAINLGGSTKPSHNSQLAQIIERAKKMNMPAASITNFLEKMELRQDRCHKGMIEIRGPSSYIILVSFNTSHVEAFKMELNSKLKRSSGRVAESSARNLFTHVGNIIVEKKGNLDQAMENAINVGAEDVEEFEEDNKEYFHFKCDPNSLNKIQNLLEKQYCVVSAEEDYIPNTVLQLSESDLEAVNRIRDRILSLEDVTNVYENIE